MVVMNRGSARLGLRDLIRYPGSGGFTLVELLIVVTIMAIMVAIALPRFEDIGRGSKMRAAINELRSTVALARQWAIANREDVFIVLPDAQPSIYPSTNYFNMALRSYAIYTRARGYVKDWNYLPAGIYFVDTAGSSTFNPPLPACVVAASDVFRFNNIYFGTNAIPFPTTNSPPSSLNAVRITSQGWLQQAPGSGGSIQDFDFYLVEAVPLETGSGNPPIPRWKANPVLWKLRVNPWTGVMRTIDCSQQ